MRLRPGSPVTVHADAEDPYILQFQRYAVVSRVTADGDVYVVLDATMPPNQEFGPFPSDHVDDGWRDSSGRWRS